MLALAIVFGVLSSSCAALNNPFKNIGLKVSDPEDVPRAMEKAQQDLERGKTDKALRRLKFAGEVRGLPPETRDQLSLMIEDVGRRRIEELSQPGQNPKHLAKLVEYGLPPQLAVTAGVRAARAYQDIDEPKKAYKTLKKLEDRFPRHHAKVEAGSILAEAGLQLADDPWSFLGFFKASDRGMEILEYLVITYPAERRCDEAYFKLAELYERRRKLELARERSEDLVLYHPESPMARRAEADVPRLRLKALKSPEYDRREMLKARVELETWLERHEGNELEPQVRLDYADCLQRLTRSDLGIAKFYRRIDEPYGARRHAVRALETARQTGDQALVDDTKHFLDSLPPEAPQIGPVEAKP